MQRKKKGGDIRVLNRSQHADLCTALQHEIMAQISYILKELGKLVSKNMNLVGISTVEPTLAINVKTVLTLPMAPASSGGIMPCPYFAVRF